MRIAFISNHPAPYRDAFLSRFIKTQDFSVEVFSLYPSDTGHSFWNLEKPDFEAPVIGRCEEANYRILWRLLKRFVFSSRYDLVIWPGLFCKYLVVAVALCAVLGKKYAYIADSIKQPKISRVGLVVKRYIVQCASFIFVPGEASVKFFMETFGLPRERIVKGAYALNGDVIEHKVKEYRKSKLILRTDLGIAPTDKIFLMVANMIPSRHYPVTASAFVDFAKVHDDVKFIMVGNGPDNEFLRKLSKMHPCLYVVDGCSFEEMLKLYAIADVYVHGGAEPASTALVIGAISGLPLISSPSVGCYFDVVCDEVTGLSVADYLNRKEWSNAFVRIYQLESLWKQFGARARGLSRSLDIDVTVKELVKVVKESL